VAVDYESEQIIFENRVDAGRRLASRLGAYRNRKDVIVLGIPRGGVPVAFEVAAALGAPLDVFVSRKLGVPGQEELAFGALASGGVRILDREIMEATGISDAEVERITADVQKELERRENIYRGGRRPLTVQGQTVILVDDGIATGSSMRAAINALRRLKPARLVVAVPVAPRSTYNRLRQEVDDFICVLLPEGFYAIGQFYEDFSQVADEEVTGLLLRAEQPVKQNTVQDDPPRAQGGLNGIPSGMSEGQSTKSEVSIEIEGATLQGILSIPKGANGLVLFAHGSGSSRYSPRNRYVAQVLHSRKIATLLFDLLTREEEAIDRYTGELRFDIPFLAERLVDVTRWIMRNPDTAEFPRGYFGASTGAGAALVAASEMPDVISAVVSRGGRPDLAQAALGKVRAATLLIVGGNDEPVIDMNREALAKLKCPQKKLIIVPGATHLFEEPGTLEEVARLAAEWFCDHLIRPSRTRAQAGEGRG
jgi:putative phosphoribosyl transferase